MSDPTQGAPSLSRRPLLTAELPGVGGSLRDAEDFVVEEIPAYLPCGQGEHCFALVRKRYLTTAQAVQRICSTLGLSPAAVGHAGLKDRRGVTVQWLSFAGARPEQLRAIVGPDLEVLEAKLHRNKLRTGHLRGNRFTIVLRETGELALERAQAVFDRLEQEGLPNYYGEQRFGQRGDNAQQGMRLLRGENVSVRDRMQRRLLVSALQSEVFNRVLATRLAQGALRRLLGGEVLQRTDSGGLFVSEDRDTDERRLLAGEVCVTGPICGPRMPLPQEGSPARALEDAVLAELEIEPADFGRLGRLARGGRRPLTVPVREISVERTGDAAGLRLRFLLPPGAYASEVLREVSKAGMGA